MIFYPKKPIYENIFVKDSDNYIDNWITNKVIRPRL